MSPHGEYTVFKEKPPDANRTVCVWRLNLWQAKVTHTFPNNMLGLVFQINADGAVLFHARPAYT
jgi:hypothetical protein